MKKQFLILALVVSAMSATAQKPDSSLNRKSKDSLTVDTKFLSVRDIDQFINGLKDKWTVTQYEQFWQAFNQMVATKEKEYYDKK
jgi:hypothetical protein